VDRDGDVFLADTRNHRVRRAVDGGAFDARRDPASRATPEGLPRSRRRSSRPPGLLSDPSGGLWISESFARGVRRCPRPETILTMPGNGTAVSPATPGKPSAAHCRPRRWSRRLSAIYIADSRQPPHPQGDTVSFATNGRKRRGGLRRRWRQRRKANSRSPVRYCLDSAGTLHCRHREQPLVAASGAPPGSVGRLRLGSGSV